ncbi:MAG: hypothetical protein KJ755_02320, partial [Alphaproteobacteria bacterium]|nr:hypothetical protein [Alphaproteobacteria bacterium]
CRSVIRRPDETDFGFAFAERTPETFVAIAEMMYCDQQPLQDRWNRVQKHKGFFTGTIRFALWTITETLRGFTYALRLVRETTEVSHPDAPMVIHAPGLRRDTPAAVSATQRGTAYA